MEDIPKSLKQCLKEQRVGNVFGLLRHIYRLVVDPARVFWGEGCVSNIRYIFTQTIK